MAHNKRVNLTANSGVSLRYTLLLASSYPCRYANSMEES